MTATPEAPTRHPLAQSFDTMGDDYYRDPALHLAAVRDETPVFFYPPLHSWIVTRRADVELVLSDWQKFSSAGNTATVVPEQHRAVFPQELVTRMILGMDPPLHTESRNVAQRGFTKARMEALQPEIEARANRIIDKFENNGAGNLMEDYSLELTTQTIMALLDLDYAYEPMMRQLRDDLFTIIASAHEDMPEDFKAAVWDRFIEASLVLRDIIDSRRDSDADDLISVMASARKDNGEPALSTPLIALHVAEFAAAGTDTTSQAMTNAVLFVTAHPEALDEAIADPELWPRVFEETVRRRPSSTFTGRRATADVVLGGAHIRAGDNIQVALASANTDPEHVARPFEFDIHRPAPEDHLAFTKGRHTCLGQSLARVQGATGLKVLFERLPSLRPDNPDELDFLRVALLPFRRSLHVSWDVADVERQLKRVQRQMPLTVLEHRDEADGVLSLTLGHPDGGSLPAWSPGAHIDLHCGTGDDAPVRQYSLSSSPAQTDRWRVGVLREPDGRGGSAYIHQHLRTGSQVTVTWPRNNFPLRTAARYLFIAGGIGITPLLPMIEQAEAQGADWQLLYGGRTRASMAFVGELTRYGERVQLRPQDELGLLDLAGLLGEVTDDTLIYCCGPEPLLAAAELASAHWPVGSLHTERFAPRTILLTEPDTAFQVEFAESGITATVPAGRTILDVAEENGITTLSSCKEGTCGTCETRILAGRAEHRDSILTTTEQEANETLMICVSRAEKGCGRLVLER
ncbi:cytochrome P450 [Georgenia sp. SYP-B2076]|uniref:cytochrome P450 n=1 Tax=Georgenia sp. SYP-B2076 TaxID=2495881 RepID=UPI000F8D7792|nr:cytochrome P450 [Georgenia sp. SYP-B2076]